MVWKTIQTLNSAARQVSSLKIRWVKAHLDNSILHRGNYFADASAKIGAQGQDKESHIFEDDLPYRSFNVVKSEIHGYFMKEWNTRWVNNFYKAKCRETKHWFPTINPRKAFQLISGRSRYEYSILVHAITGHNHLAYHENKQNKEHSPVCTLCEEPGSLMTTKHLFTECPSIALTRQLTFGTHAPEVPYTFSTHAAVRFLRETNVGWLPTEEKLD